MLRICLFIVLGFWTYCSIVYVYKYCRCTMMRTALRWITARVWSICNIVSAHECVSRLEIFTFYVQNINPQRTTILLWRVYMFMYPTSSSRSRRLFCSIPHMNILYCFLLCSILGNHSLIIIYAILVGKIHLVTVYVYTISCLCINTYIAISVHRKYLYYTFIHINLSCVIRLKQRVISDWYAWWRFSG